MATKKKGTLAHLNPDNDQNPRVVKSADMERLKKDLAELGALDGVIYNRRTKRLVGGHQRTRVFLDEGELTVEKTHSKPTKQGTVAEGYIVWKGERFPYREVDWPEATEKKANIVANTHAGGWDYDVLANEYEFADLKSWGLSINLHGGGPAPAPDPSTPRPPVEGLPDDEDPPEHDFEEERLPDDDGGEEEEDDEEDEGGDDEPKAGGMLFPVNITLNKVESLQWSQIKDQLGKRRDTDAFQLLLRLMQDNGVAKLLTKSED